MLITDTDYFPDSLRTPASMLNDDEGNENIEGKIVIITGGNRGLGFEVAKQLASLKAKKVIIGCRRVDEGETAAKGGYDTLKQVPQY